MGGQGGHAGVRSLDFHDVSPLQPTLVAEPLGVASRPVDHNLTDSSGDDSVSVVSSRVAEARERLRNRPGVRRRLPAIPTDQEKLILPNTDMGLQQIHSQNEQFGQVLQSLANRVDDLADTLANSASNHPSVVEAKPKDSIAELVAQMKTMIEQASKTAPKRKRKAVTANTPSSADETDSETVSNRHLMRPMKFDGTGSFETFIAHFRNCADHNKWTKTEQLSWLKGCLIKNAGQVL
jgi:hypothetical protein